MSREQELGLGEASIDATNERLAGMDFSFNFSAAPEKTETTKDAPKKEEPAKLAGGFSNFSFGGGAPSAPAAAKEEPKKEDAKPKGGGGGFSNFSFGGASESATTEKKASITRDGKRTSVYNPEKGSREEELGLAGACIEETTKNLNAMDFSFNFDAPAKTVAPTKPKSDAGSSGGGGNGGGGTGASSREEELGMGKASVEDTTARLSNMSFSFGPEREAAEKKAKEEEEAKKQKIIDDEAAVAAQKRRDEEAAAAAVKFAQEQAESNPTFIYENVTPDWVTKVAEAQSVLGKGLSDEHPDRIAASAITMQEAGRIEGMIAAMDWDADEGLPAPAPPKETPWAPGAVIAAQKAAAAAAPEPTEEEQAAAVAAARAKIYAPEVEEEEKPETNYTEIYEAVTPQWSKKLADAQTTLGKGLPDQHPEVVAARVIALAESDRISGMVDAMDAEDEDRVPDPPTWTPWAPVTAAGYQGTVEIPSLSNR